MMIHLVALVRYGSHRWCLSHVGTEGPEVEQFRDRLFRDGLRRSTVIKHVAFLKGLWTRGEKAKLVASNPFRDLELRAAVIDKTVRFFSRTEIDALIESASTLYPTRSLWWTALIVTAHSTGMRISELEHLRWEDINLRDSTWSVRPRNASTKDGHPIFAWSPKGRKSRGPFPMPARTVAALTALKVASDPSPYIFMAPANLARVAADLASRGHLPDRCVSGFKDHFPRIRDHAAARLGDWEEGRSFHCLRKTFGTEMSSVIMPPVLQRIMGHSTVETTMSYYVGHGNLDLADKIAQCFGGPHVSLASTA